MMLRRVVAYILGLGLRLGSCTTTTTTTSSTKYSVSVSSTSPFSLTVFDGYQAVVKNTAVLTGHTNSSTTAVSASRSGAISNHGGHITAHMLSPTVVQVSVNSTLDFVGAVFSTDAADVFGVWEYPFAGAITNANVSFDLKGVGNSDGINWSNARAPFFIAAGAGTGEAGGYGVYADTLAMGSYDFGVPGQAQFIFNTSSLVCYIVLPREPGDFKSVLKEYTALSARISMPPDSAYGPTFWSDDFEQDFHGAVSNAQENIYDVVNHLYYNEIHATSMFADRPYGTGNMSFGNFDFDPVFYPTPAEFIANLSAFGFDFQVWAANRAFLDTQLFNDSEANGWLFPGIDPVQFVGPALNLSIPAAYDYFKQHLAVFPDLGVKGYKIDRGEEEEMPVYEQNIQMTLFEQLCHDVMAAKWGANGFYNFARSAVDRARAHTGIWNGDSHSNWQGLAYSVASGIRAGLVGFSMWGSDTGGYTERNSTTAAPLAQSEELWARWMHFSTFSPVYELVLGTGHTPYYAPYTPQLVAILKQTANLHHALIPFIKSHTHAAATHTGVPVLRALLLEAPADDDAARTVADEYFFGAEFLVAPIVTAGGVRSVYFPRGSAYLEYFNKTAVHAGGTTADVALDINATPVYVREGAIVPRGDVIRGNNLWTKGWAPELEVEVFPSYGVPASSFAYFGENEAQIKVTADGRKRTVTVAYEDLGVNGSVVVYTKKGPRRAALVAGGGRAVFGDVESIFGG